MKYSKKQISKAGNLMLSSKDYTEVANSIKIINEWRSSHLVPLKNLNKLIVKQLKENSIQAVFSSQRLKRLTSIEYKLDLNPKMGLGNMQDIGGLRFVFRTVNDLNKVLMILKNSSFEGFTLDKINNYIEEPKESGYRSIHLIYIYHSDDPIYDGLKIELQIRTKLQHNWATAVETAGLYTKTSLKSSQGSTVWLSFFKITSSLFAIKEKLPVMKEHRDFTMEQLMVMCYTLNQKEKISSVLSALRVTVESIKKTKLDKEYHIIHIDFANSIVKINSYNKNEAERASVQYSELEKTVVDGKDAVVFVLVSSIKDLQNAYPSYFLDTSEFINALNKIGENCKLLKLV